MVFDIDSLNNDEKFALLYGIMLGDGCLSHYITKEGREKFAICIAGCYYDDREFYETILVPILKAFGRKSVSIKERPKNGILEINFPDKLFFNKINSCGFPVGKKGTKLFIPDIFYKNSLVSYVIAGFMATDGSLVLTKNPNKYYPRIEACGICEKLIKQIVDYLNSVGFSGSFYTAKRKKKDTTWGQRQQPYRFQFNGKKNLLLFNKLIGFVNPKHEKKFLNFLRYAEEYDNNIKGIPCQSHYKIRDKIRL